jgi:ferredoxin--NADP+ reductase
LRAGRRRLPIARQLAAGFDGGDKAAASPTADGVGKRSPDKGLPWALKSDFSKRGISPMSKWVEGKVAGKHQWSEQLVSLQVAAPEVDCAGQFARLGLRRRRAEPMLGRPYSFVNPPQSAPHGILFQLLPEGPLSPRLASSTPAKRCGFSSARTVFSMPGCPMPRRFGASPRAPAWDVPLDPATDDPWEVERVVLVHAVRHARDLSYSIPLPYLSAACQSVSFVPFVSREAQRGAIRGRIPGAISTAGSSAGGCR